MPSAGRLTLTWAHKDNALISTPDGGYEWVDRDDPRANEVRLLDEVDRVGEVTGDASDNLLIRGDGLDALRALVKHPEYASEYRGKVKLVYIDPPFNTGQAFEHYDDGLEHSVWLGMMRERLDLIADLLAPDGSVWVHLDDAELHYCKVLMDEVFGRSNHVGTAVWQKADSGRNDATGMVSAHDSILVYRASPAWGINRLDRPLEANDRFDSPDGDPDPWWDDNPTGPAKSNKRQHPGIYGIQHPITGEMRYPSKGRGWGFDQQTMLDAMSEYAEYKLADDVDAEARAQWSGLPADKVREDVRDIVLAVPLAVSAVSARRRFDEGMWPLIVLRGEGGSGGGLGRKSYIPVNGMVVSSWWSNDEVGHNRQAKSEIKKLFTGETPFSTPKPERLLQRVIHVATAPGDIVVDVFAGSGTTAAVAHKMGRRWVTAEVLESTVDKYTGPRLRKVVSGADRGGVSKAVDWHGGGGFRELRVSSPVFEVAEVGGMTLTAIADGVDTDRLAASVAAQLRFARHTDDELPFAGRKGRTRLAVIRGVLDVEVASTLLAGIDDGETLLVAATAVDDDARDHLREHSRGSRVVRIPSGLFPKGGVK